jgi:formylglycine-generating enzyme required for sulfatase activity
MLRFAIFAILLALPTFADPAGMALVIGNGAYPRHPVPSAYNDALDVAVRLRAIGYKVDLHTECDRRTLYRVVREHLARPREGASTIIYYSGHAVRVNGRNYIVPVGALPDRKEDIEVECLALDDVLAELATFPFSLVLLDACREHAFPGSGPGLANLTPPAGGMVCQSAPPGEVTRGHSEGHSLFTTNLLRLLGLPNVSLPDMLSQLRGDIMKQTNGAQIPWIRKAADAPVANSAPAAPAVLPLAQQTPLAAPSETRGIILMSTEFGGVLYIDGHRIATLDAGIQYRLRRIQAGERALRVLTPDNRIWDRRVAITAGQEVSALATFAPRLPTPRGVAPVAQAVQTLQHAAPPIAVRPAATVPAGVAPEPYEIEELGIKLMVAPAGSFTMGSPETEKGRSLGEKQRQITISRPFWIGRTELTRGQFFTLLGKTSESHSARPIDSVSWMDAMDWCTRLTARERAGGHLPAGYEFRLPTEAEWEYACRADSTRAYAGKIADMAWFDGVVDTPREVGLKSPNRWGLHDMHGNAWEHVFDYYSSYRGDNLRDPTGPPTGRYRTIRGGSCLDDPAHCRSAFRRSLPSQSRLVAVGFRIVLAPEIARND